TRTAEGHHDELDAVLQSKHGLKQWSKQQPHEQREPEEQTDAERAVAVALDREDPSVEDREHREERKDRARAHEPEVEIRSDRSADDRGDQRKSEEPIGVAQHPVLLRRIVTRRQGTAGPNWLKFSLHFHPA